MVDTLFQGLEPQIRAARLAAFRDLHAAPEILIVGNCWDAVSARVLEEAGFAAIATSSAALAWSLGYRDGEKLPADELLAALARIARCVQRPFSVDLERGFGETPEDVAEICLEIARLGAVGINIEDGGNAESGQLNEAAIMCARIAAIKSRLTAEGLDLFVNARTDVFLHPEAVADAPLNEAVARAERFKAAGADGIFAIRLSDAETIRHLIAHVDLPLNLYYGPGMAPVSAYQEMGVARLSLGVGPAQAALAGLIDLASFIHDQGDFPADPHWPAYPYLNDLFG